MGNSMSKMLATAACLVASHLHDAYLGAPTTINDENKIPMDNYVFSRHLTADDDADDGAAEPYESLTHQGDVKRDSVDDKDFVHHVEGINKLLDGDGTPEANPVSPSPRAQDHVHLSDAQLAKYGKPPPLLSPSDVAASTEPEALSHSAQTSAESESEFNRIFDFLGPQRVRRYRTSFEIQSVPSLLIDENTHPLRIDVITLIEDGERTDSGSITIAANDISIQKGKEIAKINMVEMSTDPHRITIRTDRPFREDTNPSNPRLDLDPQILRSLFGGIHFIESKHLGKKKTKKNKK